MKNRGLLLRSNIAQSPGHELVVVYRVVELHPNTSIYTYPYLSPSLSSGKMHLTKLPIVNLRF